MEASQSRSDIGTVKLTQFTAYRSIAPFPPLFRQLLHTQVRGDVYDVIASSTSRLVWYPFLNISETVLLMLPLEPPVWKCCRDYGSMSSTLSCAQV